jgi:hypothetical protein
MKKISSVICLSFLVLFLIVSTVIGSSDWMEYYTDNDGTIWSYKKVNIDKGKGKYIVQVWEKRVYSDKNREEQILDRTKDGLSTEGWDKLSEGKGLVEIDCKKLKMRVLSVINYDTDGKVLSSDSFDENKWKYIIPDTLGETLRNKVCNNK